MQTVESLNEMNAAVTGFRKASIAGDHKAFEKAAFKVNELQHELVQVIERYKDDTVGYEEDCYEEVKTAIWNLVGIANTTTFVSYAAESNKIMLDRLMYEASHDVDYEAIYEAFAEIRLCLSVYFE